MLTLEGYTNLSILHQGKRFSIYRALRGKDNKKVILKVCRYSQPTLKDIASLQHEHRLLSKLTSPHIIKTYGLIKQENQLALEIEDIDGIDLQEFIANQTLSLEKFLTIALQVTDALNALHIQDIIHKDINPSNIIINPSTLAAKIIDLGISIQLEQEAQDNTLLKELEGTLAYISPEQTGRMNRVLDYRTDFYSLGVAFYEMLTGQLPFVSSDPLELIHCHIAKHATPISKIEPKIPEQISLIVNKLLAKVPEERYASCAGLKADLQECQRQWLEKKSISPFKLGRKDVHDHLALSQKLYGRDTQLKDLLVAFERICSGSKELILISGYSGIGKTSLVKELYKPITEKKGYFISGKYDQLRNVTPFSAFIEAFEDLMRRLLAEPQEKLEKLKQDLLTALGANGQVITAVIPNIKYIIGEQPAVPDLPPVESQNRFMITFQNFVRALAQDEHPLTLFLDDLQWVDSASLHLLIILLKDKELKNLMIIGSYRNNEVAQDHPLMITLQELENIAVKCKTISLSPLELQHIQQLLADTLSIRVEDTLLLAKLLLTKTEGNPFFINEFLKRLHQDKLLNFSYEHFQWQWDIDSITKQNMTDNVIDLLTAKIEQLVPQSQQLLKLAACIGHIFDLHTLAKISGQSLSETAKHLWPAVQNNLITPLNDNYKIVEANSLNTNNQSDELINYRFTHDKIQQSAYQLIDESQRQATHLLIGQLLIKYKPLHEQDERLFDILNHFNQALALITNPQEGLIIANANIWACQKAKKATAYESAKTYCKAGIYLLGDKLWDKNYSLTFSLHKELMECEYLTGNHAKTSELFQLLSTKANNLDDKIAIYRIQISMLNSINKEAEALNIGLKALRLLGITFPKKPNNLHIIKAVLKNKLYLVKHKIRGNAISPTDNKKIITANLMMLQLASSAYMVNPKMFMLFNCYRVYTTLKHGCTETSVNVFLSYAYILVHVMQNFNDGFDFESRSKQLKENLPNFFTGAHIELFVRGYFYEYLIKPLDECLEKLMHAYVKSLERGDLVYANYSLHGYTTFQYFMGKPLSEGWKHLQNFLAFKERAKVHDFNGYLQSMINCYEYLQGSVTTKLPTVKELENKTNHYTNLVEKVGAFFQYLKLFCIFGKHDRFIELYELFEKYKEHNQPSFDNKLTKFYYCITLASLTLSTSQGEQEKYQKMLNIAYTDFKIWGTNFPTNLLPYDYLIDAMYAQTKYDIPLAMSLFEKAIQEAKRRQHLELIALANEYAARFYLKNNKEFIANAYMAQAHYAYIQWGAIAKVKILEQEFPAWFQDKQDIVTLSHKTHTVTTTATTTFRSLDTLSIFKSAQVLSSEIKLEDLLQKMLSILLEAAGAQRAVLISKTAEQWYIEAEGSLTTQNIYLDLSKPLTFESNLPMTLISYAERTQELILIQNSKECEQKYQKDSYLKDKQPQSILTLPIIHQHHLKYLLYFENKDVSHAFTPESINTLQLLASQAAISLENAKLYHQATHDILTGLANRSLLQNTFNDTIRQFKHKPFLAVLFLDLDGFKKINDTLGHEVGDKLLIHFAQLLKAHIEDVDMAARLGGDEFVIMLKSADNLKRVKTVADNLLQDLKNSILISGHEIWINTSIGISLYPNHGSDIETLLKNADTALYKAKSAGKGQYQFY